MSHNLKKPEMVRGWRTWWRQWSTWLAVSGLTILNFTPELVEALHHAWTFIPMDIKTHFPPEAVKWSGYIIGLLSVPAKLIRQPKLKAEADREP